MARVTRRTALAAIGALGAGTVLGVGYVVRNIVDGPAPDTRLADGGGGFAGAGPVDMSRYMEMFNRHNEITRRVEEIPGGVRTTTESNSAELTAQLQAHVASMYAHLDQRTAINCMSQTLPTLFREANGYRRRLTITPTGVIAEETADDPSITQAIRAHAREVTGFVQEGMPAMMQQMTGGGMTGPGGMMSPR